MSVHQIIYTSCMRGINGVNDGQQIFSYDAEFKDVSNEEIKSLFSYRPPALDPGVVMTEELALTMPRNFVYRKLKNNCSALSQSTYLGRDYMGSAGRFGNQLSHVIVADPGEMKHYPCEFYGSSLLRDHMEFEEVNNPNQPDYLPTPVLVPGNAVNIDEVMGFLSQGERMSIYKNMLHSLLHYESQKKRLVICDEPKNIVLWIAALEYALPLKTALSINFSTYDYDPALSSSRICGVVPKGTRFAPEEGRYHFYFDLYQSQCPEFEKDELFSDFLDVAMSLSYDSMQDFHRFLTQGYSYDKANEQMYDAYRLYSILSDGLSGLTAEELKPVMDFIEAYALPQEKERIFASFISRLPELGNLELEAFELVMAFLASRKTALSEENLNDIKGLMVDKVLQAFLNDPDAESDFNQIYAQLEQIGKSLDVSIATELMRKDNRRKIFTVMDENIRQWQMLFIVHLVCSFVKDRRMVVQDLAVDTPVGQLYRGLIRAVYSSRNDNSLFVSSSILDEFSWDCSYLTNMAMNLEGVLLDLPDSKNLCRSMWSHYEALLGKHHKQNYPVAYRIFFTDCRYDLIAMLYHMEFGEATSCNEKRSVFHAHYQTYLSRDERYAAQYGSRILEEYHQALNAYNDEEGEEARLALFDLLRRDRIDHPCGDLLVREMIKTIPVEEPSKEDIKTIDIVFDYLYHQMHKPLPGKLQLLVAGVRLGKCKRNGELRDTLAELKQIAGDHPADLSRLSDRALEKYLEWIMDSVCPVVKEPEDLEELYGLFRMDQDNARAFFAECGKHILKQSKKDTEDMLLFLNLVFRHGQAAVREDTGKLLRKMNKQLFAELNIQIRKQYRDDRDAIRDWDEIAEIATSSGSLFEGIAGMFKKKK